MKPGADTQCKGLRYAPHVDGSTGSWVRRFKTTVGKMRQYTFAQYPDVSLGEAREYIESVRGQENTVACQYGEPTIAALIERYLNEYIKAQRGPQAILNVRSALFKNLEPIRTKKLDQVTASMLHELILTIKKRAPTMAQSMRAELSQAWSYGLSIGLTNTPCPITSMTGGRFTRHARDRILSDTEIKTVMHNPAYSPALADTIIISLYTGMRSGEVVAIHASEFETDSNGVLWLTIPRERMKNDQAHRVPFFSKARSAVESKIINQCGYVFSQKRDKSKHIKQVALAREVYDAARGAWRLHDLRRTARTNLQRIGCPFEISETILAHKLPGVASVYARYQYNDEKIKWLSALADHYDNLIQVKKINTHYAQ